MRQVHGARFTLEQVVQMPPDVPGAPHQTACRSSARCKSARRDATLIEVVQGAVEFVDTRTTSAPEGLIKPVQAVLAACLRPALPGAVLVR